QILHGRGLGRGGGHNNGVFHGTVLFELAHHVGNGGRLLPDGDVNTRYALPFLSNDGIDGNGGFTRLAGTNDEFSLSTPNWYHRGDGFDTRLPQLCLRLA